MKTMVAVVKVGAWADEAARERIAEADDATVWAMVREEIEELVESHQGRFEFRLTKPGNAFLGGFTTRTPLSTPVLSGGLALSVAGGREEVVC